MPQPVAPTSATYCPGRMLSERLSITSGMDSEYLNETFVSSMLPLTRVTIFLPSLSSGSASMMGLTSSRIGRICATVDAMPASPMNAPEIMP